MLEAALPREPPDLRIRHVVVNVREPLGLGVRGPDAFRATEVWNAGLRGNAGARQRHDARRSLHPTTDPLDHVAHLRVPRRRAILRRSILKEPAMKRLATLTVLSALIIAPGAALAQTED